MGTHCSPRGVPLSTRGLGLPSTPTQGPAGWAQQPPSTGSCRPPRPGCACARCYTPTPWPPHLPLPHRPLGGCSHPALCSCTPLIKGSATLGCVTVPGMRDHRARDAACTPLPAPTACDPPAQAEGGRERRTLKSIYWCWPRSELLGLPRPWPRCCCGVHGWVEGGAPAMKSPRGASPAPPTPQPPAPRVQRGSSRGRGPGLAPFDVRFLSGSVPGTRGCSAAKGGIRAGWRGASRAKGGVTPGCPPLAPLQLPQQSPCHGGQLCSPSLAAGCDRAEPPPLLQAEQLPGKCTW